MFDYNQQILPPINVPSSIYRWIFYVFLPNLNRICIDNIFKKINSLKKILNFAIKIYEFRQSFTEIVFNLPLSKLFINEGSESFAY